MTSDFQKSALLQRESQDLSKTGSLDFPKSNRNNTDLSKTERNDTESFYDLVDGMERAREKQEMEQLSAETLSMMFCFCGIHPVTGKSTRLFR